MPPRWALAHNRRCRTTNQQSPPRPRDALYLKADPRVLCFLLIEAARRPEEDFVGWAHAYETWEMVMELGHLRYFVAVADAGSLTVAAEQKLQTSQHLSVAQRSRTWSRFWRQRACLVSPNDWSSRRARPAGIPFPETHRHRSG
jgi:hypothetical protein